MAQKKIPLKDKELIKKRIAVGYSTRDAIKDTAASSHVTAFNIAHQEMNDIEQLRNFYIQMIRQSGADEEKRAKLWVEMTEATKIHSSPTGPDREVPDWQSREKALKYVDTIIGIAKPDNKPSNIVIGILPKSDYEY